MIEKSPTRLIGRCYKDGQTSFTANMNDNKKLSFLTKIPTFQACSANLYKFMNFFIPKNPALSADLVELVALLLIDLQRPRVLL